MNNFEKIKSLTLDEMAEWLYEFNDYSLIHYCYGCGQDNNELGCKEYFKQWLQQESEG